MWGLKECIDSEGAIYGTTMISGLEKAQPIISVWNGHYYQVDVTGYG